MNRARIVVLTVALGAGGIAAYLASGTDNTAPPPSAPVAQLPTVDVLVAKADIGLGQKDGQNAVVGRTVALALDSQQIVTLAGARQSGTLSLALRSIVDGKMSDNTLDESAQRRGDGISIIRYGVASQTATIR